MGDLECQIDAYPPPAIKWYKDGLSDPLTTNQHYRIGHFVNDDQHVNTILRAVTIEKNQYGRFICEATNRLGSSTPRWNSSRPSSPSVPRPVTRSTTAAVPSPCSSPPSYTASSSLSSYLLPSGDRRLGSSGL